MGYSPPSRVGRVGRLVSKPQEFVYLWPPWCEEPRVYSATPTSPLPYTHCSEVFRAFCDTFIAE